ncbi:HET domain-containing protein [Colletotrichum plurivorum]|uniref:HET domain-containing protein n=1 Tax=Colletotrichum plurivorum TaxID=2175906 RepID=A0A8H6KSP6_9PEZI|nr:HET domain-containing protein [Colletotrichum plurivorum]
MESPSAYEYRSLPNPRFTRLLVLHRGSHGDPSCPLTCRLEMDMCNPSSYFALSYTWNNETPSEPLLIQNSTIGTAESAVKGASSRALLITPNCAMALRLLQRSMSKQWRKQDHMKVWVDAICINQQSSNEKSAQVAMMAEIYRGSESVVVWLGQQHAPPSPWALAALQPLVVFKDKSYRQKIKSRDLVLEDVKRGKVGIGDMALGDLGLVNSGFYKKNSGERMRLFLGRIAMKAGGYIQLFNNLCWEPDLTTLAKITGFDNFTLHWQMHNNLAFAGSEDGRDFFMGSLIQTEKLMRLKASEPRDKIFALRTLSARTLGKIPVDYERPTGVLFAEVTKELIKTHRNPELLYFSSISKVVRGTRGELMPSWAVDFGVADGCFLSLFNPLTVRISSRAMSIHADITLQYRFWKDSQRLSVMGARIGEVGKFVGEGLKRRISDGAWVDQYGYVIREPLNKFISSVSAAVESEQKLDRTMGNSIQKMLREIWAASEGRPSRRKFLPRCLTAVSKRHSSPGISKASCTKHSKQMFTATTLVLFSLRTSIVTLFDIDYIHQKVHCPSSPLSNNLVTMNLFKRAVADASFSTPMATPGKKVCVPSLPDMQKAQANRQAQVDTEYVMVDVTAPSHKQQEQGNDKVCDDKVKIAILEEMLQKRTHECVALRESLETSRIATKWLQTQLVITTATEPEVVQH